MTTELFVGQRYPTITGNTIGKTDKTQTLTVIFKGRYPEKEETLKIHNTEFVQIKPPVYVKQSKSDY